MDSSITRQKCALAGAALLTCLAGPASAQFVFYGTTTGTTIYDGPIDPVPPDCGINLYLSDIIDAPPKVRPVLQKTNLAPRTTAQQLPSSVGSFGSTRQVAYSTNFSRLNMQIPPLLGVFSVAEVRARVYAGPTRSYPLVASQVRTDGTASIAWSATAAESAPIGVPFQTQWLVAVQSIGRWKTGDYMPWFPASVMLDCMMTVKPPTTTPPPVLTQ